MLHFSCNSVQAFYCFLLELDGCFKGRTIESMAAGVIYILFNESFPNLIKVGLSTNSAEARAAQISKASGVPTPFKVAASFRVRDVRGAERMAHDALAAFRPHKGREFFNCSVDYAVSCLRRLFWCEPTIHVSHQRIVTENEKNEDRYYKCLIRRAYKRKPAG